MKNILITGLLLMLCGCSGKAQFRLDPNSKGISSHAAGEAYEDAVETALSPGKAKVMSFSFFDILPSLKEGDSWIQTETANSVGLISPSP